MLSADNEEDHLEELLAHLRAAKEVFIDPNQPTDRRRAGAVRAINSVILYLQKKSPAVQEGLILPFISLVQALYDLEEGKQADFLRPKTGVNPKQDQVDQRIIRAAVAAGMHVLTPMCSEDEAAILVSNLLTKRDSAILQSASANTIKGWRKNFRRNPHDKRAIEPEGRKFFDDFVEILTVQSASQRITRSALLKRLGDVLDDLAPKIRE